jgi:hypothetical protein
LTTASEQFVANVTLRRLRFTGASPIDRHQPLNSAGTRSATMSINRITGVSATERILAPPNPVTTPAAPAVPGAFAPQQERADFNQPLVPSRFPWLSRLSQQLESASQQRAAFPPAPSLGDHVDHSA